MEGILIKKISFVLTVIFIFLSTAVPVNALSDSSASSVVINADTLEILYENDPYTRRSMASTTKIMTALLLCESGRLDETIVCSKKAVTVEGSAMGLRAGDRITGRDLLYGLLLMSGNDAANVIAEFIAGSNEKFAEFMNKKASELGFQNTNFVTPSGLDDDLHYTTAYELAVLTAYALENPDFKDACGKSQASVRFGNPPVKYTITNHNRLLKEYDGCIGVKTGFTKKSGRCLVSAAERDGKTVIVVTLKDPNDWRDHKELLDYGFDRLITQRVSSDNRLSVPIIGSETECSLSFDDIIVSCLEENADKLSLKIIKPEFLFAPVSEGAAVGRAEVLFEGRVIAETPIFATSSILSNKYKKPTYKESLISVFKNMIKTF